MSFLITDPALMSASADELQAIGAALAASNTATAAPTTSVLPPAADSVSARTAALLDAHAQQYQAFSAQAEAFQNQFVQTLNAARNFYVETEASNTATMQLTSAMSPTTPSSPSNIALIMGGTGNPSPSNAFMTAIDQAYLAQQYPGYNLVSLTTPEQFWPVTGLGSETFTKSVQQGVAILNNAIITNTGVGDHVVVVGYSQSATIATLEMRYLDALPAILQPQHDLLNFVLLADPNNVLNGGILTHFIPGLGAFHVPTPLDTPYMTAIYTIQYDAIANFPRSVLWLPSDLNALFGFLELHSHYPMLTAAQVATALQEHIANTTYYFIPTAQLPLLDPLRLIPILGNPLANLLQPFVQPFVDFGYGSPFMMPGLAPLGVTAGHAIAEPLVAGLAPTGVPALSTPF
ncbi:MAG TPA: PE-PPE domain-containing protein [Mycobacterium sp.]|nr:PE-PPE domain-containing protein [Mycobacterium sp.]HTX98119.1 PE-PPE domain-containing protein [Mycobacterium sp.]